MLFSIDPGITKITPPIGIISGFIPHFSKKNIDRQKKDKQHALHIFFPDPDKRNVTQMY